MKKPLLLILVGCCLFIACNKNSDQVPVLPAKPLQVVISNITTTLTIYSFSITNQSSQKLIDVYSQLENKTYTVNVNHGDILKVNYFLELEGLSPATDPVVSFIYEGAPMLQVTNNAGIVTGSKYIAIP